MPNSEKQSRIISRVTLAAIALVFAASAQAGKAPQLDRSATGVAGVEQGSAKRNGRATYIVQLSEPAVANYDGGIGALRATSVRATGARKLDVKSAESQSYVAHLRKQQDAVLKGIVGNTRGSAQLMHRYFYSANGFAMRLTAAEAEAVAKMPGVASVQPDVAYALETDSGPTWIGAPAIWEGSATGVAAEGEGMVVGIMDSGINHGHPSFAEVGGDGYGAGGEYAATNPFGAGGFAGGPRDDCSNASFPGLCNNKLIGAYAFIDAHGGVDPFAPPGDPVSKDTDGHGSHVASTAAGNEINSAPILDADGDPTGLTFATVSGVAPHAHIIAYKVCAPGCFGSDIAAAIDQAITNGADALNHSIGAAAGSPWADFKSLAFKNARAAGIMLQNSAGNSGPGAGTAARINASPWATGVAASTHDRVFPEKTLENMSGGATTAPADITGRAVTDGISGTIVYAGDFPVGSAGEPNFDEPEQCLEPFPPGTFSGQIVVCDRGAIARVQKGRNVRDGGAGGMVLANVPSGATSLNDDAHVIPAIHIDASDGDVLRAWLDDGGTGHSGTISGTGPAFSDPSAADIMAGFSSRGPYTGFDFLAPHVSAPGANIYAAGADLQFVHTGTGNDAPSVPAEWGIISGTSMSSPHATGSATLVKQLNPDWTAAEVKSALMTTAVSDTMLKEDGVTPADPFDIGGGRVQVDRAAAAGLVLDETIANFDAADPALGGDPKTLNLPDLVDETCTISCSWQRTVKNVSGGTETWTVTTATTVPGFVVTANPSSFTLADGATQTIDVVADTTAGNVNGWNFGTVDFTSGSGTLPQQHLTVAAQFLTSSNAALFSKSVDAPTASVGDILNYEINVSNINETGTITVVDPIPDGTSYVASSASSVITGGSDISPFAYDAGTNTLSWQGTLDTGGIDVVPDPFPPAGSPFGYVDLSTFVAPLGCSSVCDDTFIEIGGLPPFTFAGNTYTDIVISSNGYIVAGTDTTSAFSNAGQDMPSPTAPNNVLAPFWTDLDLDGTNPDDSGAGDIYGGVFNSGQFIVIEWQDTEVWNVPGPTYTFQIQIATDLAANPGIWFVYRADLAPLPSSLSVGAENEFGTAGDSHYFNGAGTAPIPGDLGDLRVDSTAGGTAVFNFQAEVDGTPGDTIINVADYLVTGGGETSVAITEILVGDTDGDGVFDDVDNCTLVANADQRDTNGDGIGNACDADVTGPGDVEDCVVNFLDLAAMKAAFFATPADPSWNPDLDFNGDDAINFADLATMKSQFFGPPGPSAAGCN